MSAALFFSLLYWLAGGISLAFAHSLLHIPSFVQFSTQNIEMIKHPKVQHFVFRQFSLASVFNDNKSLLDGSL